MAARSGRRRPLAVLVAGGLALGLSLGASSCGQDEPGTTQPDVTQGAPTTTILVPGASPEAAAARDRLAVVQAQLAVLGCYAGPLDGRAGADTDAALAAFQQVAGLGGGDLVGPKTQAALARAASAGTPACGPSLAPTTTTTAPPCDPELPEEEGGCPAG